MVPAYSNYSNVHDQLLLLRDVSKWQNAIEYLPIYMYALLLVVLADHLIILPIIAVTLWEIPDKLIKLASSEEEL